MGPLPELTLMTEPVSPKQTRRSQDEQDYPFTEEAQQPATHPNSRQAASSGRSFNFSRLVQAARRSFELTPRENVAEDPEAPPPTMKRYYTQALWLDHQAGMHVAHAPPPGLAEPLIPPEPEEDEHEYVEHVDVKAISLAGLREFIKSHNISCTMTTHQVVRSIVIPATMGRQNCALIDNDAWSRYALPAMDSQGAAAARKAAGPLPPYTRMPSNYTVKGLKRRAPYYYVVHAWSRPFLEMVSMLEAHFAGRPAEHTYVWLDIFAIPQVSPNHSGFLTEIQRAIWYATSTLACFDISGTILSRLWCIYEMFFTISSKGCAHALVALTSAPLTMAQRTALYRKIDANKARCSVKEDKKKLMEHVHGYTRRGMPAINNYLCSGIILPPYNHPGVYLPHTGYEESRGFCGLLPCAAPPPPPAPPAVPDHVAMVPEVAQPSVRKGNAFSSDGVHLQHMGLAFLDDQPLRLIMGACNIPHPSKTKTGGEDAFFISAAGRGALGVADGVGSWSADDGVDPAAYARDLMRAAAASLEASAGRIGARMALADAHLRVKHAGSSTSVLAVLPPDSSTLQVINVGDSGLRLVRDGRLAMATRPQAHAHNMPYQLACPDEPVCDTDSTVQGDLYNIPLEVGDVIILATDGMYDNVWPDEILMIVNKAMSAIDEDATMAAASFHALTKRSVSQQTPSGGGATLCATASDGRESTTVDSGLQTADGEISGAGLTGETSPGHTSPAIDGCGSGGGEEAAAAPGSVGPMNAAAVAAAAAEAALAKRRTLETSDSIGRHAPIAGDDGEAVRADASSHPLPAATTSTRASALARTLARTAAANMLRRDVRTPFAVELSKQPMATPEFRCNPRGGKPDDVTVVVAVVMAAEEPALEGMLHESMSVGGSLDATSGRLPPTRAASGRLGAVAEQKTHMTSPFAKYSSI